jgi:hypothetical protein
LNLSLALKADLESPIFTGSPNLPISTVAITQAIGNNSTKLATTAFVNTALANFTPNTSYNIDGGLVGNILYQTSPSTTGMIPTGGVNQFLTSTGTGIYTWTSASNVTGNFVPYTGATQAVNLGAYDLTVNGLTIGKGNAGVSSNVGFGYNVLTAVQNSGGQGSSLTAIGYEALKNNSTGFYNTATGYNALKANTIGASNTSYGSNALTANTTGGNNAALGSNALKVNIYGSSNTAIGYNALNATNASSSAGSDGSNNTAIGNASGASNTSGTGNTFIGNQADASSANLTNATAIGNGAVVDASNKVQIGNTSVTSVVTSGSITAAGFTGPLTGNVTGNATNVTGVVAVVNGGTGSSTAAGARANLGLVIGTDVMAANAVTSLTGDLTGSGNASIATTINSIGGVSSSTIATLPGLITTNTYNIISNTTNIATLTTNVNTNTSSITANANAIASVNITIATKENSANKSTDITADASSDVKFPSVKAIKNYVDAQSVTAATNSLTFNTPLSQTGTNINISQASAVTNGYLSSADFAAFMGKISASEKGANNGVATLGSNGKIPSTQIPAISFQSVNVVADQTEMLALSGVVGSVAVRTDVNKNYVLSQTPASNLTNWIELATPNSVATVNGFAGPSVVLTTNDIATSTDKNYVTDVQSAVLSSTTGVNTGDETASSIRTKLGVNSLSGVNTGDQTITLTGDVTGSGTTTFGTTIQSVAGVSSSTIASLPSLIATNTADIATLNNSIGTNTTNITTNSNAITSEANTARAAEQALSISISANTNSITSLLSSNNIIGSSITSEANTARAAEQSLSTSIASNTASITSNTSSIANINSSLNTKENLSNKSTDVLTDGGSDTKYPSVKSVKTYVDAQSAAAVNSLVFNAPLTQSGSTIGLTQSSLTNNGYLSATDFAAFTNKIDVSQKGANNGVASLGSNGKIPSSQIPAISFQSVNVVANETAMLGLSSAVAGSIAVRTDLNKNYVLSQSPASTLANWVELATPNAVTSVNGYAGPSVSLTTNDIASVTNKRYVTDAQSAVLSNTSGVNTGDQTIALTGDVTGLGTGTFTTTLANTTVAAGAYGSATAIPIFNVDAKGRLTTASSIPISTITSVSAGNLTGTTLASNVVNSSLTRVGTITSGTWSGSIIAVTNGGTGTNTSTGTGSVVMSSSPTIAAPSLTSTTTAVNLQVTGSLTASGINYPTTLGTNGQYLTSNGAGNANWTTFTGISNLGTFTTTSYAAGGTISGTSLILSAADNANPGLLSTGVQTINGPKTFTSSQSTFGGSVGSNVVQKGMVINPTFTTTGLYTEFVGLDIIPTYNLNGYSSNKIGLRVQGATIVSTGAGNDPSNTAIGTSALNANTASSGGDNTAIGMYSLLYNTNGTNNTALGASTLSNGSSGSSNTAIGKDALRLNTGSNNVAIGAGALDLASGLTNSIAIGQGAAHWYGPTNMYNYGAVSGSYNVFIGSDVRPLTNTDANEIVFGSASGVVGKGTNTTTIGNTGTTLATIYGTTFSNADATATNNVTNFNIKAQDANASYYNGNSYNNNGGVLTLLAGNASGSATGGNINLTPGNASNTGTAGNINLNVGSGTSSGTVNVNGQIKITGGSPGVGKVLTSDANGLAIWATAAAGGSGVSSLTYATGTSYAAGGTINGTTLSLTAADAINPGLLSASSQIIGGAKTFSATTTSFSGNISLNGSVSGGTWSGTTIDIAHGGTGATTFALNNILLGNGTSSFQTIAPSTSGNVLTSNGTTWLSSPLSAVKTYTYSTTANTNAGTISGTELTLFAATETSPGFLTSNNQTIGGIKTFNKDLVINGINFGMGAKLNSDNIAIGINTIQNSNAGNRNIAIGSSVLHNDLWNNDPDFSGEDNVGIGYYSQSSNYHGGKNTSIGAYSLSSLTQAYGNTGVGYQSLQSSTTGLGNTAVGSNSILNLISGSFNSALGYNNLSSLTSGDYNISIGYNAGGTIASGTNSIYIGKSTNASASNVDNEIVLGSFATGNGSNTTTIGNIYTTSTKLYGALTVGGLTYPTNIGANGQVLTSTGAGTFTWTTLSNGLSTLNGLSGVTQTFANSFAGTSPSFGSSGTTHTLYIPMASSNSVTAGLISKSDYDAFNNKQAALTTGSGISIMSNTIAVANITSANLSSTAGITNNQLQNSVITLGSTALTLGSANTSVAGLTNVTATNFIGTLSGTANSATKLATARTINGTSFDGTANITITDDASTLTGATLASNITSSSLTGVGTITSGTWNGGIISGQFGGTGINNNGKTITLGGNLTTSGAYNTTLYTSGTTNLTLPTNGTIATLSGTETLTNKTYNGLSIIDKGTGFRLTGGSTTPYVINVDGNSSISGNNTGDQLINLQGDVTGSGTTMFTTTLASSGVTAGTYGSATAVPTFTVDSKGRLISASNTTIAGVSPIGSALTSGNIIVGNASNAAAAVAMSGDVTISNSGVTTIGAGAVSYGDIQNVSATDKVLGRVSAGSGSIEEIATTGSGNVVRATSATLVTPNIGAATATSLNKVNITAPTTSATLTIADGKTLSASNTLTLAGTDASTLNIGTGGTLGSAAFTNTSAFQAPISLTTTGSTGAATFSNNVLNIPNHTLAGLGGIGLTGLSATAPLSYDNTTGAFSIPVANTTKNGYLSSADWTSFNNKQVALTAGSGISIVSGTISATGLTTNNLSVTAGITNGQLANKTITIGTTGVDLGTTSTILTGLSTVTSTNFVGTLAGNASSASTLATARNINGVAFNGSSNITVTSDASTLTGSSLNSTVTGSSLSSVGTLTGGTWNANIINPTYGGTGVNNGSNTITLGGNLSTIGAFTTSLTSTANTVVTLPTIGTLATLAGSETFTNKTLTSPVINGTISGNSVIPIANGGTGSSTQNFVDLTTAQSIAGNKTFTGNTTLPNLIVNPTSGAAGLMVSGSGTQGGADYIDFIKATNTVSRPRKTLHC